MSVSAAVEPFSSHDGCKKCSMSLSWLAARNKSDSSWAQQPHSPPPQLMMDHCSKSVANIKSLFINSSVCVMMSYRSLLIGFICVVQHHCHHYDHCPKLCYIMLHGRCEQFASWMATEERCVSAVEGRHSTVRYSCSPECWCPTLGTHTPST